MRHIKKQWKCSVADAERKTPLIYRNPDDAERKTPLIYRNPDDAVKTNRIAPKQIIGVKQIELQKKAWQLNKIGPCRNK